MLQTIIHTTENNNHYIYDDYSRLSMLIHPEIRNVHENGNCNDVYYYEKYKYLKEHGFFSRTIEPHFEMLDESDVKDSIIQTNQIVFEVTSACNLDCVYCGYGDLFQISNARSRKMNLDVNKAIQLIRYIYDLKIKNTKSKLVIGFYGGEPLLKVDFMQQIINEVDKLNVAKKLNVEYSITTNATLLDRCMDFLVKNNVQLAISLDGDEYAHSYRIYKGNGKSSFDKVIENVDALQKKYPIYFDKSVNFISVLHNRNTVKCIYEFICGRYHKIPEIVELNINGGKSTKAKILQNMFHSKWMSEYAYRKEAHMLEGTLYESLFFRDLFSFVKYYTLNYYLLSKTYLFKQQEKFFPTGTCLPFSLKIFLTAQNKILPCEKINPIYALGEIKDSVELNIKEIVQKYNKYYEYAVGVCSKCYNYKFCGSCIFHFDNLEKDKICDLNCKYFKDREAFEKDLYYKFSFLEQNPAEYLYILDRLNNNITV